MKPISLILALSTSAFGQSATIGPAVFGTTVKHDAHSNIAGTYTGSGTHTYDATICATGTPDTFKWRKDSGSFSSCTWITGAAQTLTDGIQLRWAATTGHAVKTNWRVLANSSADQPIGEALIYDLNDAVFGGRYTGTSLQNNRYQVTISAVGTPDTFTWSVNGGAPSSGITITGGAQAIADGITVTFGATTGHTLGDYWTSDVTVTGSLREVNTIAAGAQAKIRTGEDTSRDRVNARSWGVLCDGVHDDSVGATYAARYAFETGRTLEFPAGRCRFDHQWIWPLLVQRPDQPYGQGPSQSLHIVGQGPQEQISPVGYIGGTVLWYTPKDGTDFITFGSQVSTLNSLPTYSLENVSLLGPDTWTDYNSPCNGSACGSGSGIKLVQSTGAGGGTVIRLMLRNVTATHFLGPGSAAFWAESVEYSTWYDVSAVRVNSCAHIGNRSNDAEFNANTLINFKCDSSVNDGLLAFGTDLNILGGTFQRTLHSAIHLFGQYGALIQGVHFEANNSSHSRADRDIKLETDATHTNSGLRFIGNDFFPTLGNGADMGLLCVTADGHGANNRGHWVPGYDNGLTNPLTLVNANNWTINHEQADRVTSLNGAQNQICDGNQCYNVDDGIGVRYVGYVGAGGVTAMSATTHAGGGLADGAITGNANGSTPGPHNATYSYRIAATGTPDTASMFKDGIDVFGGPQPVTTAPFQIADNVWVHFGATTGHTIGETGSMTTTYTACAAPQFPVDACGGEIRSDKGFYAETLTSTLNDRKRQFRGLLLPGYYSYIDSLRTSSGLQTIIGGEYNGAGEKDSVIVNHANRHVGISSASGSALTEKVTVGGGLNIEDDGGSLATFKINGASVIDHAGVGTLASGTTVGGVGVITSLTGDVTAAGPGAAAATLAASGVSAGTCGDATHVCAPTFDAKGRATSASSTAISGITIHAGSGLSGGGTVAPGGSVTLTNTAPGTQCSLHVTTGPGCSGANCGPNTVVTGVTITCP